MEKPPVTDQVDLTHLILHHTCSRVTSKKISLPSEFVVYVCVNVCVCSCFWIADSNLSVMVTNGEGCVCVCLCVCVTSQQGTRGL